MSFENQLRQAHRTLRLADARLARLMAEVGPCTLAPAPAFSPFRVLSSSIAHQQLTGKAAQTILKRYRERLAGGKWPTPERIVEARLSALRACGFSRAKSLALKDLALKVLDGTVPKSRALHTMPEEEIITRLTEVRGVGRWTVEMMLMFVLGRLDVLPVDDYGVRKGFSKLYRKRAVPTAKEMERHGEIWRPYRTVASWYMWRAAERTP